MPWRSCPVLRQEAARPHEHSDPRGDTGNRCCLWSLQVTERGFFAVAFGLVTIPPGSPRLHLIFRCNLGWAALKGLPSSVLQDIVGNHQGCVRVPRMLTGPGQDPYDAEWEGQLKRTCGTPGSWQRSQGRKPGTVPRKNRGHLTEAACRARPGRQRRDAGRLAPGRGRCRGRRPTAPAHRASPWHTSVYCLCFGCFLRNRMADVVAKHREP